MAKKTRNIVIEKIYLSHQFVVWMDFEVAEIVSKMPGIVLVRKTYPSVEDQYDVIYDPRYDWEELQSEIELLANSYAED